jgi:hypothetical protein
LLNCSNTKITKIPREFTQLTRLNCSNTKITEIPKELTQLIELRCGCTNITEIPKELTQLAHLYCSNTNITEIPREFTQLIELHCWRTNITEIPRELTRLIELQCRDTKITEIPVQSLLYLTCHNCPNLFKIPLRFKKRLVNKYNFLRVPTKSRMIFNQYKKGYLESVHFNMEIKFNEVYWAPGGKGALELFQKYKLN